MKITVVIPVFKVENYIARCLASVLCQSYRKLEIILVDDCTPDRSMEVAKEFIEKTLSSKDLSFSYLKHEHNRGLSAARNTGIEVATGDYVYFLDSDDELCSDKSIELLVNEAARHNRPDVVCGSYEVIVPPKKWTRGKKKTYLDNSMAIISFYTSNQSYMMAWNKMVRLDFLRKHNLYFKEGLIHEDDLWSYLLYNKAKTFSQISDATYRYYENPNTIMTASGQDKHNEHRMTILREFDEAYAENAIVHCKDNRVFIARQKVFYWESALLNGTSVKDLSSMFWKILSMSCRILFIMEFVTYFTINIGGRLKDKFKNNI